MLDDLYVSPHVLSNNHARTQSGPVDDWERQDKVVIFDFTAKLPFGLETELLDFAEVFLVRLLVELT